MKLVPFIQRHRGGLAVLVLLLPLCFVGIRTHHDWGDDFAQYINQAKCIRIGEPASETGYIYNTNNPMLGPAAYPGGFPLLLSPVYVLFGNNIAVFNIYISLWLVFAGLIWYLVLRKYHNELTSVLVVVLIAWHPWVLEFKAEIMSEIPFMALTGLLLLMYQRGFMQYNKPKAKQSFVKALSMGIVAGLLLAIRLPGLAIIAAIFAYDFWANINNNEIIKKPGIYANAVIVLIVGFITCFPIINYFISGIGFSELFTYSSNFKGEPILTTLQENLAYYTWLVQDFFQRSKPTWKVFPLLTQALVLALCVIGIVRQTVKNRPLLLWVFGAYMVLLLIYPYRGSGFRFLLPVAPIILHFAIEGFKSIQWGFKLNTKIWAIGLSILLIFQFLPEQILAIKNAPNHFAGPQEKESVEAFAYIKQQIPKDAVIVFAKPRALALYTGCKAFANHRADSVSILQDMERFSPTHILIHTEISDGNIKQYIAQNPTKWMVKWQNNKFTLYVKKELNTPKSHN